MTHRDCAQALDEGWAQPKLSRQGQGHAEQVLQQLVADFAADWREHGAAAIEQLRKENVAAYVKIATSLVPRELLLQVSRPLAELSDDELQAAALAERDQATMLIEHIRLRGGAELDRAGPARGAGRRRRRRMTSAAKILEQRRKIRSDLTEWCRYAGREPAKHHRLILKHLSDVAAGKTDRLALCLPPGAGKSVYTQLFAAWWLANNPTSSIILASHTQNLADRQSIVVRNLVEEHGTALGIAARSPNHSRGAVGTQSGAEVRAVGGRSGVSLAFAGHSFWRTIC